MKFIVNDFLENIGSGESKIKIDDAVRLANKRLQEWQSDKVKSEQIGANKMTIQEALKANETKRVRRKTGQWIPVCALKVSNFDIIADWEAEEAPKEIWVNEYDNGVRSFYPTRELADGYSNGRISCKKYREVLVE